ncbi:hypothetical protein QJS10_CPA10g02074 [Acorus calamus]|uniref:Lon N-terminal domain-containing protein n=1 Tax=Acorus calamus TaxID=4465 RepID=A0AAV9E0I0_ACOCL|nr:hypothetical protein QJS10_CPA10g02074 [Acorus calamus]
MDGILELEFINDDDNEGLGQVEGREEGISVDVFSQVYDLMRQGNRAFREGHFEQLALKDADKVVNLRSNSAKSYFLKASALKLVRRIMEGNHRMGMVGIDPTTGTIADFACEVEISECEPLPDGRFYIEVEGCRRFRIKRSSDQDGYRVAEVQWIQDISSPEGTQQRDLQQTASAAAELARSWIARARDAARTGRRSRRLELLQADGMSSPQDPERFSFWLVNLLNLRPLERLELLRLRDMREPTTFDAPGDGEGHSAKSSNSVEIADGDRADRRSNADRAMQMAGKRRPKEERDL